MLRICLAAAAVFAPLIVASPAGAAEPIMPLSQVQKGMKCTGLSVVQGTDISSFDVEILDVVAGDAASRQPLILARISGPAVAESGLAEGFSGSPIVCPDEEGTRRIAGALAYGTTDYGGDVALATPIEAMLGMRYEQPARARRFKGRKRELRGRMSVAGLSPAVARLFNRAARRAGRAMSVAPFAPLASAFAPQTLVPGASLAAGLASGDISAGSVGTVTYVDDAGRVFGFGHPFDGVGRRTLLLQDAYVYTVIANPTNSSDAVSQKLAAPGHDLGTVTYDGPNGVVGTVGGSPPLIPLRVTVREGATGAPQDISTQIVDETAVGLPTGVSALSFIAPMAVAQASYTILDGSPARTSGSMCVEIEVVHVPEPMGFCNTYVGAGGGPIEDQEAPLPGAALVADLSEALAEIDAFEYAPLQVTSMKISMRLERGLRQAFLLDVDGPRRVRRGQRVKLRLELRHNRGPKETRTITARIPRDAKLGERDLTLVGTPADGALDGTEIFDLGDLLEDDFGVSSGPKTLAAVGRRIASINRYDGVRLAIRRPGANRGRGTRAYRDRDLRISGVAKLRVVVRK
jgi:hypothetical protein